MAKIDWAVEQGSLAWYRLRCGIPTSSEFDSVMTPKTRKPSTARFKYACRILAGRLMNWQADSLDKIDHIRAGKENEPIAVARLEVLRDIKTRSVGFVRTDDLRFGASPDRAVARDDAHIDICIEIKSPTPPIMFEYLLLPDQDAYICQRQGHLLVCEADKAIFHASNPFMEPECTIETGRDEPFIKDLADCLERFSAELEEMDRKARALGMYQAVASFDTPLATEYRDELRAAPDTAAPMAPLQAALDNMAMPRDELDEIMGWNK
jgi:hypothetical protein